MVAVVSCAEAPCSSARLVPSMRGPALVDVWVYIWVEVHLGFFHVTDAPGKVVDRVCEAGYRCRQCIDRLEELVGSWLGHQ